MPLRALCWDACGFLWSRTSLGSPDLTAILLSEAAVNQCDAEDEGFNPRRCSIMEWKNPNRAVALIYNAFVLASKFKKGLK